MATSWPSFRREFESCSFTISNQNCQDWGTKPKEESETSDKSSVSNFAFRLQKVYEYRELEEGWAKDNFLAKHISRMEAENEMFQLEDDRKFLLSAGADDLNARVDLEIRIQKLDDHERALRILIHELTREEDKARDEWILKKQDKSVLEKLRDKAYNAWMYRQDKLEQAAVDEWSVQKQRAA